MNQPKVFTTWQAWSPYLLSILRIVAAALFLLHGTMKLFAFPEGMGSGGGTVNLLSEIGLAGVLEVAGGVFLLLGLFTRPVAFLLSGQMAVAFFQAHAHKSFWPTVNGGELAMLYCFLWLYFSTAGAGMWSIDAMRRNENNSSGGKL